MCGNNALTDRTAASNRIGVEQVRKNMPGHRASVGPNDRERALDEDTRYDLVVIGSGPAGESGAHLAATAGYRVAIVERLGSPGGVVVANGGVPTKTLRETATYLTGFMDRKT